MLHIRRLLFSETLSKALSLWVTLDSTWTAVKIRCYCFWLFLVIFQFQKQDQYILTVKAQDLNGKPEGRTGTGTVTINVIDVNDKIPKLTQEQVVLFPKNAVSRYGIHNGFQSWMVVLFLGLTCPREHIKIKKMPKRMMPQRIIPLLSHNLNRPMSSHDLF